MKRIHVLGLPRSGTTALSEAVAGALELPLAIEPIFLWTDGFRVDLSDTNALPENRSRRIRDRIKSLDAVYRARGGFVEKTPSSVFFAPLLGALVKDATVIVITRENDEIVRSLERKVLEGKDGNVGGTSNLFVHNMKVRAAKSAFMVRTLGPISAVAALARYSGWARRNGIGTLADSAEIRGFVARAKASLDQLDLGATNRMLTVPYQRFRDDPDALVGEILAFCNGA